ncbi:tetratricopeptide repeat protein [Candidatus Binatia bacterium]|nr:tetratricopeptide repeat protein [Candidatus Binatia bacterium]
MRRRWSLAGVVVVLGCAVVVASAAPARANVESQALYARGLIPFNRAEWVAAYQLFNQAVEADPEDAVAIYYRGLAQARGGQAAAAIGDFERALSLDPNLPHAALDLGIAYYDTGQYAAAQPWLEKARQQPAERYTAALFQGLTLYRLGDLNNALAYLNEARGDPEVRTTASYYAGLTMLRLGNTSAARELFTEVANEQPQSEIGQAARAYLAGGTGAAPMAVKPWGVYGQVNLEYDSNVVIGPDTSNPGFVAAGLTSKGDGRAVVAVGGHYRLLETDYGALLGSYDFSQSLHFDLTQFNLTGNRLQLHAQSSPGPLTYGISAAYDIYLLDFGSFYQEGIGLPWLSYAWVPEAPTQVYFRIRGRDFLGTPYNPGRDAANYGLGLRQWLALGDPQWLLTFGYLWEFEDTISDGPAGRDFQYKSNQLDIGVTLPRLFDTTVQLAYLFRLDDYQYPNSRVAFAFARHDNASQFVIGVVYDMTANVALTLDFIGIVHNSNILDFEYPRIVVGPGVRVSF